MASLFGVDLALEVNSALGPGALAATITRRNHGARTPGDLSGGRSPIDTSTTAKGWVEKYGDAEIDEVQVLRRDRKVVLLGASVSDGLSPKPKDRVTISGTTYEIIEVGSDPASATYICQARSA